MSHEIIPEKCQEREMLRKDFEESCQTLFEKESALFEKNRNRNQSLSERLSDIKQGKLDPGVLEILEWQKKCSQLQAAWLGVRCIK